MLSSLNCPSVRCRCEISHSTADKLAAEKYRQDLCIRQVSGPAVRNSFLSTTSTNPALIRDSQNVFLSAKGVGDRDASNLLSTLQVFAAKNSTLTFDCRSDDPRIVPRHLEHGCIIPLSAIGSREVVHASCRPGALARTI